MTHILEAGLVVLLWLCGRGCLQWETREKYQVQIIPSCFWKGLNLFCTKFINILLILMGSYITFTLNTESENYLKCALAAAKDVELVNISNPRLTWLCGCFQDIPCDHQAYGIHCMCHGMPLNLSYGAFPDNVHILPQKLRPLFWSNVILSLTFVCRDGVEVELYEILQLLWKAVKVSKGRSGYLRPLPARPQLCYVARVRIFNLLFCNSEHSSTWWKLCSSKN